MPQVSGAVCLNTNKPGRILCNFVSVTAKTKLSNNGDYVPFVTVTFKAVSTGDTSVDLTVKVYRSAKEAEALVITILSSQL